MTIINFLSTAIGARDTRRASSRAAAAFNRPLLRLWTTRVHRRLGDRPPSTWQIPTLPATRWCRLFPDSLGLVDCGSGQGWITHKWPEPHFFRSHLSLSLSLSLSFFFFLHRSHKWCDLLSSDPPCCIIYFPPSHHHPSPPPFFCLRG
jgi:hypothetical protein